jgi:hypothetical protein
MIPVRTSRNLVLTTSAILTFSAQAAFAGNVGVNLNINVGEPPRQVVVAPPPPPVYVAPPPVYAPAPEVIRVEEDIQFVYPEQLGFYVAVGVPYDLFYVNNSYFIFRDGRWLRAASPRGPWVVQMHRDLPQPLRRNRLERIRECRTREYAVYSRDRDHYRGRHFRSEKEQWKERQREAKERRHEEKHFDKERRKEEKHLEKEQRKEDKRWEKEERKEAKHFENEERREHREGRRD